MYVLKLEILWYDNFSSVRGLSSIHLSTLCIYYIIGTMQEKCIMLPPSKFLPCMDTWVCSKFISFLIQIDGKNKMIKIKWA